MTTTATNTDFDRTMTSRAVAILRNVEGNIVQARNESGDVEDGEACATQVLYYFLDDLRDNYTWEQQLDEWLPLSVDQIVRLNDTEGLTFSEIADRLAAAAGLD